MQGIAAETARVALLMSLVLFALALPRAPSPPAPCACPYEIASQTHASASFAAQHQKEFDGLAATLSPRHAASPAKLGKAWTVRVGCRAVGAGTLRASEVAAWRASSPLRGPVRLLFGRPIDLRRADAESLMVLPGIGATRAQAILALREAGGLHAVSDLLRVKGIGPKTLRGIETRVAVDYAEPCACTDGAAACAPNRRAARHARPSEPK